MKRDRQIEREFEQAILRGDLFRAIRIADVNKDQLLDGRYRVLYHRIQKAKICVDE